MRTITLDDIATIVSHIVKLNNTPNAMPDDIDHLGSRRVRFIGEILQQKMRVGLTQMKRNIQDKMSTIDTDATLPTNFISPRPLQARLKEFSRLTNFLNLCNKKIFLQKWNISERFQHLVGGLTRERAGFEVRDVHPSHYGRLCPIHTPEGPNIGLILRLAIFAKVNDFGMIETPYAKVVDGKITNEILYMNAFEEDGHYIAHAAIPYSEDGTIIPDEVEVRFNGKPDFVKREKVDFIDVCTRQAFSVATSLIPFLEHDDANRALMGSNMQKQATPCIIPEAPVVATGMEEKAAKDTGRLVLAEEEGVVVSADARNVVVKNNEGKKKTYKLINFSRTNGFTVFHQRPSVSVDEKVKKNSVLADTSTSENGQLALGQNIKVAFMTWFGANYEDAIIISEKLVKDSKFTSVHIEEFSVNVRETKLGPEITTHDIPNVSEFKLKNLDEDGIVRIGAEVRPGDILVGKLHQKAKHNSRRKKDY